MPASITIDLQEWKLGFRHGISQRKPKQATISYVLGFQEGNSVRLFKEERHKSCEAKHLH